MSAIQSAHYGARGVIGMEMASSPPQSAGVVINKLTEMDPYALLMGIAIQAPVGDCFGEVGGGDVITCGQVGDGAGDFEDAVVGAGGEA